MRWIEWRSIGHVPGYCFQCRGASSHGLFELSLNNRRWFRTKSAPYGHEMRCGCCGLRGTTEPSTALIRCTEPIAEPEAALLEAYGEDTYGWAMVTRQRDLEAGLLDANGRFDLLVRSFFAVGHHAEMPDPKRSGRRAPEWLKFGAGFVLAFAVGLVPDQFVDADAKGAFPVVLPAVFTVAFMIWHTNAAKRSVSGRAFKAVVEEMAVRLVEAVRPLAPTGFDLREAQRIAAEQRSLSGWLDPEDILLRLGGNPARHEVRPAA